MRTIIAGIAALVVGLVAGVAIMNVRYAPDLAKAQAERLRLEDTAKKAKADLDRTNEALGLTHEQIDNLSKNNDDLSQQLAALRAQQANAALTNPPDDSDSAEQAFDEFLDMAIESAPEDAAKNAQEDAAKKAEREKEQAARHERIQQYAGQMRQNMQDYLDAQAAQTSDPVVQERLQSLGQYSDYLMDLRKQLRDAQTPEQKEALRQELQTASHDARKLVHEQQDYMLGQVAQQYGVKGSSKQQGFATSVRETIQSPFFRADSYLSGSGGRDHGGRGGKQPKK